MSLDFVVERARFEELEKINIDTDVDKYFQVGVQLPPWEKEELVTFLRTNVNVFAWSAYEAPEVDQLHLRSNHLSALLKSISRLLKKRW